MADIIIRYKPRDIFRPYHEAQERFCLTVAHRRAGKTVARLNKLLKKAVACKLPNPRFAYLAPYYVQAKDIAWTYLKHYTAPLIALGGRVNESELSVTLPHNNAVIRLYGAENAERMRGVYFDGVVVDEAQGITKVVLSQILMPALADRQGWLDVAGTPKGWINLLGELYKIAKDNPEWFCQVLKASKTGILPSEELARQAKLMSDDEYAQEFECSFDAAIAGAVYGKWMSEAETHGRINDRVQYDSNFPVYTSWDLGYDDATAIWFFQRSPNEILNIDYYEFSGEGIGHYCDMLKGIDADGQPTHRAAYRYETHYVPHDAANKLQAAGGRSIVEQAYKDHGVKMMVIPSTSQQNGIEACRMTLPVTWFNASQCAPGVDALKNYHFEYDNDLKIFRSKPSHDWSSHAAKAFELQARMWRQNAITQKQLDNQAVVAKFHRLREENNLDRIDPYKVKPSMGKKRR